MSMRKVWTDTWEYHSTPTVSQAPSERPPNNVEQPAGTHQDGAETPISPTPSESTIRPLKSPIVHRIHSSSALKPQGNQLMESRWAPKSSKASNHVTENCTPASAESSYDDVVKYTGPWYEVTKMSDDKGKAREYPRPALDPEESRSWNHGGSDKGSWASSNGLPIANQEGPTNIVKAADAEAAAEQNGSFGEIQDWIDDTALRRWILHWMEEVPKVHSALCSIGWIIDYDVDVNSDELIKKLEYNDADTVTNPRPMPTIMWSTHKWLGTSVWRMERYAQWKKGETFDYKSYEQAFSGGHTAPYLRPAEAEDMTRVASIYNQEVLTGWRALDVKTVSPKDWTDIHAYCRTYKMPFIVAVTGFQKEVNKVIGFAYLDYAKHGIMGYGDTSCWKSTRLYLFVEKEHRRKRVGSALLECMMRITVANHVPKCSYHWLNPKADRVYNARSINVRGYRYIEMEVYIKAEETKDVTKNGDEYKYLIKWLSDRFGLTLITHVSNYGALKGTTKPLLDLLVFNQPCEPQS